jgi:hypothetical protein
VLRSNTIETAHTISLSQRGYIKSILEDFKLADYNPFATPMRKRCARMEGEYGERSLPRACRKAPVASRQSPTPSVSFAGSSRAATFSLTFLHPLRSRSIPSLQKPAVRLRYVPAFPLPLDIKSALQVANHPGHQSTMNHVHRLPLASQPRRSQPDRRLSRSSPPKPGEHIHEAPR